MPQPQMPKKLKLTSSVKTCNTRTNTQKRFSFYHRRLDCKSRKRRDIQNNRQLWPGVQNEAGQRLTEFCQENTLAIANTPFKRHKKQLYIWTSPDGQYQNQIDYVICSQRGRSSKQSAKTRPGADCGSNHQLLIVKFRLQWEKVGKPLGHSYMTQLP